MVTLGVIDRMVYYQSRVWQARALAGGSFSAPQALDATTTGTVGTTYLRADDYGRIVAVWRRNIALGSALFANWFR